MDTILANSDARAARIAVILMILLTLASVAQGQGADTAVGRVADGAFPVLNFILLVVVLVRLQVIRREQANVKARLERTLRAGVKESGV